LTLDDGSKVEMNPRAELSVVRLLGDLRVRLTSGTVLITAAKQKEGHHLFVETKDCVISVIGTVFQVNAEKSGSRISVIEAKFTFNAARFLKLSSQGNRPSTSPELGPLPQEVRTPVVAQENTPAPPQVTPAAPKPFEDIVWVTPPAQAQNGAGVVRGVVKNGASGEGIPDVTVTLCPAQGTTVRYEASDQALPGGFRYNGPDLNKNKTYFFALWDSSRCLQSGVKTDSAGRFEFKSVANGEYVVGADRDGYVGGSAGTPDAQNSPAYFSTAKGYTLAFGGYVRGFTSPTAFFKGDRTTITVSAETAAEISLTLGARQPFRTRARYRWKACGQCCRPHCCAQSRRSKRWTDRGCDPHECNGGIQGLWLQAGDYRVGAALPNGLPGSESWFSRGTNPIAITGLTVTDGEEITNIDIVVPRR
jgi:hypothetical protein